MGNTQKKQKIVLRAGENIGAPAAEHDHEFLSECFVTLPIVETIRDITSHKCIVLGRTGAGKSALLWQLERQLSSASRINPKEVAFEHVGNSAIIQHLTDIGVDLHGFYEYLWKHVIVVHVIRECLGIRTESGFLSMLAKIESFVRRDQRKAAVVKYLSEHGGKFWIDAEEISRQITSKMAAKLSAAAGVPEEIFHSRVTAQFDWKDEETRTFRLRAQEIVDALQMRELNETINALADLMGERKTPFYVLVDDLDTRWGGTLESQYALIRALIESIKTFRRIPNLKIIVAMREDLYEATITATRDKHFQAEKFEGLLFRLRWTDAQLLDLVKRRLNHLLQHRYAGKGGVTANDVFPPEIRGKRITQFLVERTLRRPRDIIALVNKILSTAQQYELPLPAKALTSIEGSYSRERFEALIYEWQSCHPLLRTYAQCVAKSNSALTLATITTDRLVNLIVEAEASERQAADDVERRARAAYERNKPEQLANLAQALVVCLFKLGIIGLKLRPSEPYRFCYDEHSMVNEAELLPESKVIVHPMFQFALGWGAEDRMTAVPTIS